MNQGVWAALGCVWNGIQPRWFTESPMVPAFCCNGWTFDRAAMGVAIYLGLVGGGLAVAIAASIVLRGIKLI
jgi:hypothetical protein